MKKRSPNKSEILLGKNIEKLRMANNMTRMQLARTIRKNEQDIEKYENGGFVPLAIIEDIAKILAEPVPKKLIRKISLLRKREIKTKIEETKLAELYNEALNQNYNDGK